MTTQYHPEYDQPAQQQPFDDDEEEEPASNYVANSTSTSFISSNNENSSLGSAENVKFSNRSFSASMSPDKNGDNQSLANDNNILHSSMSSQNLKNMKHSVTSPARMASGRRKEKNNLSAVERIIRLTPTCFLKPKCFFVAWNSVIVLVFTGWPEPIDTMKSELSSSCTLCKEYFGSKFPKITLGCVKDGVEMTPKLLAKVRKLCAANQPPDDSVLCIDALSVVLWENRSQESIIYEKIIPLKKNHV